MKLLLFIVIIYFNTAQQGRSRAPLRPSCFIGLFPGQGAVLRCCARRHCDILHIILHSAPAGRRHRPVRRHRAARAATPYVMTFHHPPPSLPAGPHPAPCILILVTKITLHATFWCIECVFVVHKHGYYTLFAPAAASPVPISHPGRVRPCAAQGARVCANTSPSAPRARVFATI